MIAFGDSSFFVAIYDARDPWHKAALKLLPEAEARTPLHTTALVVAEVVALVGSRNGRKVARLAYEYLREETIVHLPDMTHLDASMRLVVQFDGQLSLADAFMLDCMATEGSREIFSFDRDFDGKGVERIGGPKRR